MHTPARFDIYAPAHKGLRACFAHALVSVGRLDWTDTDEVASVMDTVQDMLDFCRAHLDKEARFVHPAMESRRPGSTQGAADDHAHHQQDFAELAAQVSALRRLPTLRREAAATALYRQLTRFVTDNLTHMAMEEREHNRVLWETHSDAEIQAIEAALVASLPADESQRALRWILPALSAEERAAFLAGVRERAPAEVFDGMLRLVRPLLCERDRCKLDLALGLPRQAAEFTGAV